MIDRPIIFSAPMVRALLAGTKTQTRRVASILDLRIQQHGADLLTWGVRFKKPVRGVVASHSGGCFSDQQARGIIASQFCPHGRPGDRLWVREAFAIVPRTAYRCSEGVQQLLRPDDDHDAAIYRAGWERSNSGFRWRPSIHMPRWASRLKLEITEVRVERLQDISEADALAEGCVGGHGAIPGYNYAATPGEQFRALWGSINGPAAWDENPWVWVIGFKSVPASAPSSEPAGADAALCI